MDKIITSKRRFLTMPRSGQKNYFPLPTLSSNVYWDGEGMQFTDAYINVAYFADAMPARNFCIEFWSKTDLVTQQIAFYAADGRPNYLSMHLPWENNIIYFDCGNPDASEFRMNSNAPSLSEWNHIAIVVDANLNKRTIYINGNVFLTASGYSNFINYSGDNTFYIASHEGSYIHNGSMANFRVWDVARTQEEIITTMYTTIFKKTDGLLANWHLDEQRVNRAVIKDYSGNEYNGVLLFKFQEEVIVD